MSTKLWNVYAPAWYVYDQFPRWAKDSIGTDWTVRKPGVVSFQFYDENKKKLPMSKDSWNKNVPYAEVYTLLAEAARLDIPWVSLEIDVHPEDY
jgi:hypothetical protein